MLKVRSKKRKIVICDLIYWQSFLRTNTPIPRSKDCVPCMPVVDLVSTSSERLIESIESDRLDIKSPPSKAKVKCKIKGNSRHSCQSGRSSP